MDSRSEELDCGGQPAKAVQSGQAPADARVLHVYYEGFKYDRISVLDSDKSTVLYNATMKTGRKLTMHSGSSNVVIATFDFHLLTSRIDATVHDQSITLTTHGLFKLDYSYTSPAFSMKMTWKPRKLVDELNMVLLDDRAMPVAKFEPTNWSLKKSGKLELLEAGTINETVMDEVVATGLAVMYYRQVQRLAASA